MSAQTTVTFRVTVTVDSAAWQANYGTSETDTAGDVASYTQHIIAESVREWLDRSGNVGTVDVTGEV